MPRKKERIVSLEVIEPNSTWDYRKTRLLSNFICAQGDAEKAVRDADLRDARKNMADYDEEVRAILAPAGTRNHSDVFYTDDVNVEEVKLPASVKPSTKYVYKVYDYTGDRSVTEYGTQKDALAYIAKKIRTKHALVTYNGVSGKVENTAKNITTIMNEIEKTTSQLAIEPVGRSGVTEDSILVSVFKNLLR